MRPDLRDEEPSCQALGFFLSFFKIKFNFFLNGTWAISNNEMSSNIQGPTMMEWVVGTG